jgi:hypothetical protein
MEYLESDWDSIYSIGDRAGNQTLIVSLDGFNSSNPNALTNADYGTNILLAGQTGNGVGNNLKITSSDDMRLSGVRLRGTVTQTNPGNWSLFGSVDGQPWRLNTAEFNTFNLNLTADTVTPSKTEITFSSPVTPWSIYLVQLVSNTTANFTGANLGTEFELKVRHSIYDGGDRNGVTRPDKRVLITTSPGIVAVITAGTTPLPPLQNILDGRYNFDNASFGKTVATSLLRASGSIGNYTIIEAGEYIQFSFPRAVHMREMVLNVSGPETVGNINYGQWQWQASSAPNAGFIPIGGMLQFPVMPTRWIKLPAPIDIDTYEATPSAYEFAHWRLVLVQGPAFGDGAGTRIYQVQFNLVDPLGMLPVNEAQFSDDDINDGVNSILTVQPSGPQFSAQYSDGYDDGLNADMTVTPNFYLTAKFTDIDDVQLRARGSFYKSIYGQTMVVVKGK